MVAAGNAVFDIVIFPLLGIEMGESAGPAGPVDGAEIRGTLPGYFGGNLGGASAPGGAGRV